jgi:hypothetical protein
MRNGIDLEKGDEFEDRLKRFKTFVGQAANAAIPVFKEREGATTTGRLSPTRVKKWTSLNDDQEPLALVVAYYGGDRQPQSVKDWSDEAASVLDDLQEKNWAELSTTEREFIENRLEPFLERLERLEESESILSVRRKATTA